MNDKEFIGYLEEILQCDFEDNLYDFLKFRTDLADRLDALDVKNIKEGYWFTRYAKQMVSTEVDT